MGRGEEGRRGVEIHLLIQWEVEVNTLDIM